MRTDERAGEHVNKRTGVPFGEELLAALGAPRRARVLDSSPRSRVWRVELPGGGPAVVKQLLGGPEAAGRYAREVAALRLAGRAAHPVVPRLLGTDDDARLLVMELLEHRPPAEGWEVAYAEALARLHASAPATGPANEAASASDAGSVDEAAPASDAGPVSDAAPVDELAALPAWSGPGDADIDSFLTLAQVLGAAVPAGCPRRTRRSGRTTGPTTAPPGPAARRPLPRQRSPHPGRDPLRRLRAGVPGQRTDGTGLRTDRLPDLLVRHRRPRAPGQRGGGRLPLGLARHDGHRTGGRPRRRVQPAG